MVLNLQNSYLIMVIVLPDKQEANIRLTTQDFRVEHHITIPAHNPLRIGTLASILSDIANHFNISKEQLYTEL